MAIAAITPEFRRWTRQEPDNIEQREQKIAQVADSPLPRQAHIKQNSACFQSVASSQAWMFF
jgi:hypothetical protein